MYAKLYDLEKYKYCIIEFNSFVGELPSGIVVGEIVTDYASEKLIEDKKQIVKNGCFDFSATNSVKIHNLKVALSEYKEIKEENERLKSELKMYKENNERLEKSNKKLFDRLNELETEKNFLDMQLREKIVDYSSKDEIEILKGVINLILDGKTNEALKVLLEFV